MPYSADFTQQNGFVHAGIITAGLDNACGIAAFTLMPEGSDILTVEFKTNLLAPAKGERFLFRAQVIKPGRTLTVCEARAVAAHWRRRDPGRDHDRHADGDHAQALRYRSRLETQPIAHVPANPFGDHAPLLAGDRATHGLGSRRSHEFLPLILSSMQSVLGLASGALVGFSLGLVGGGGSILAVPLMVYVVGVGEPHIAIGTSAIAVAANAAINLSNHARGGTVIWSCALTFASAGMVGALLGSILGKMLDGQKLLALFALVMLAIAMLMLKTRSRVGARDVKMSLANLPAIVGLGARHRHAVRLLRHRRRFLDRAGADAGDRNADHERGLFVAGGGDRFRAHDRGELCLVGTGLPGAWPVFSCWAGLPAAFSGRGPRGIWRAGAARSIPFLPLLLSPWRSICWRVTYGRPEAQKQAGWAKTGRIYRAIGTIIPGRR